MVNAIVADDNKDLCITLANELNVTKEIKVIKMLSDGTKVISEIKNLKPELIILDMKMPGCDGIQIIQDIENDEEIETKVIVFSGEMEYISKVRQNESVISYMTKGDCIKETTLKIQKIAKEIERKSVNQQILEYLLNLGYSTSNQGTFFLQDSIRIFLFRRQNDCKVKELFNRVAELNTVQSHIVKNNIHTSTKTAWNIGDREYIIDKMKLGATEEISPKKVITMSKYYIDID